MCFLSWSQNSGPVLYSLQGAGGHLVVCPSSPCVLWTWRRLAMACPEGACGGHFDSTECTAPSCGHRVPLPTKCLPFSPVLSIVYMDRISRWSKGGGRSFWPHRAQTCSSDWRVCSGWNEDQHLQIGGYGPQLEKSANSGSGGKSCSRCSGSSISGSCSQVGVPIKRDIDTQIGAAASSLVVVFLQVSLNYVCFGQFSCFCGLWLSCLCLCCFPLYCWSDLPQFLCALLCFVKEVNFFQSFVISVICSSCFVDLFLWGQFFLTYY